MLGVLAYALVSLTTNRWFIPRAAWEPTLESYQSSMSWDASTWGDKLTCLSWKTSFWQHHWPTFVLLEQYYYKAEPQDLQRLKTGCQACNDAQYHLHAYSGQRWSQSYHFSACHMKQMKLHFTYERLRNLNFQNNFTMSQTAWTWWTHSHCH